MHKLSDVTALILAGGLGLRLRSAVNNLPKVLASVNGRPFITFLLDQLISAGFQHAVLCTGYLGNKVNDTIGDHYKSLSIQYSQEREQLGTGGALVDAMPLVSTDNVLVMNGDSYLDVNLSDYIAKYFDNNQHPALLLTQISDTSRYGRVELDAEGFIRSFKEKGSNAGAGWINAGIYILKKHLLNSVFYRKPYSLERELFPDLVGKGLCGFQCTASFIDIGTPESLASAKYFFS